MERFRSYLGLLSQELEYLDRLVGLARAKRDAILRGAADQIVSISDSEDSALDVLLDIRNRRRAEMSWIQDRAAAGAGGGNLRRLMLEESPHELKPELTASLDRYETKLRELHREARINNSLLSDRLMLIHHTLEKVMSSVQPPKEYEQPAPGRRKRRRGAAAPSMVVDQRV